MSTAGLASAAAPSLRSWSLGAIGAQLINYYRDQGFGNPRILLRKPLR
jgi:hypothetical protein